MKTSVIEVHDMLSVLTVDEVEERIGGVPGVESATVNRAYPVSSESPKPMAIAGLRWETFAVKRGNFWICRDL